MDNIEILKKTNLGDSVAEQEQNELENYFIKTEAWEMLNEGRIDVVYGGKGTGKSALYLLLLRNAQDLQNSRLIHLIPGEEISGDPVFRSLNEEERLTESQFRDLWKIYFLSLIGNHIRNKVDEKLKLQLKPVLTRLENEGLIPIEGIRKIFRAAFERIIKAKHTINAPGGGGYTIILGEPSSEEEKEGKTSVRNILHEIDKILSEAGIGIWILLDRLDVAFTESEIETPALRALFRAYLDILALQNIKLKIFLRDDIWERITREQGFREQSHITRFYHIRWTQDSLRHLILSRFYNNPVIEEYTKLRRETLGNLKIQEAAFYSIFPEQVESGPKKRKTFDWILNRVQDGKQNSAPREVINLIKFAREQQVILEEVGGLGSNPEGHLISANGLNLALEEVSKIKIETFWSEYPDLRKYIEVFRGGRTEYLVENIKDLFTTQKLNDVTNTIRRLIEIGFLQEKRGIQTSYWVPFIFRPYLSLTQGAAFIKGSGDKDEEE